MEDKTHTGMINLFYGFLIVSVVLNFIPNMYALAASVMLWLVTLIAAYLYRARDSEDGLMYNHMTYLIGTIWIGTTLIVIGAGIAGWWVFNEGDRTAINGLMTSLQTTGVLDEATTQMFTDQYISDNKNLLLTASAIGVGPAILYFVYRVSNGLSRAAKGYRIANPKSWL